MPVVSTLGAALGGMYSTLVNVTLGLFSVTKALGDLVYEDRYLLYEAPMVPLGLCLHFVRVVIVRYFLC